MLDDRDKYIQNIIILFYILAIKKDVLTKGKQEMRETISSKVDQKRRRRRDCAVRIINLLENSII